MALTIPDRYKDGLAAIAKLNQESFSGLHAALKVSPDEILSQQELAQRVADQVKAIGLKDVKKIIEALASLFQYRNRTNIAPDKLANDLYDAIEMHDSGLVAKEHGAEFKTRLEMLFREGSLNIAATKAKELQMDVEKAFCEAKILTDLRPIFGDQVDTPRAMIIIHTLKLVYHVVATGKREEIFIAIDDNDIENLRGILERAERKASSLISRLDIAGIKRVDLS